MADKFYFGFRQTPPPGAWVVCGPFDTYAEATNDRMKSKAADAELTNVFSAPSKEEAQKQLSR